jgi:hypothetical protein
MLSISVGGLMPQRRRFCSCALIAEEIAGGRRVDGL